MARVAGRADLWSALPGQAPCVALDQRATRQPLAPWEDDLAHWTAQEDSQPRGPTGGA